MRRIISLFALAAMVLGVAAFQCSSTELTSARLYIQQKNYAKAQESLLKEIEKNPQSDEGYYLLGFLKGEEGDISAMLENFDKSLAVSNKFASNISDSKKYHWGSNFNRGVALFNKAAKVTDEDSSKAIFKESIESFTNAIQCEPDSADTYKNLAFAYMNSGRMMDAIQPYEKLIEIQNSADAYVRLGELYTNEGVRLLKSFEATKNASDSVESKKWFNKTVDILEKGRKEYPDDSDILLLLSNAYIAADKIDVAKDAFKVGVEKEPENKYYRYNYGVLLLGANEFEPAAVQFAKAIEIDPEYKNAIYNLGVTYVKWGTKVREKAEAVEDYDNVEYKDHFKKALPHLEKYLELNPEEPAVWELLGKVYANLGMEKESKNAFDKADQYR